MFKKWWVILIQGILMLILGILIFNSPGAVLAGLSLWIGIIILITGIIGVFGWLFGGKENRESSSLIWSILTLIFGLIVLTNLGAAMKAVTIIFGLWVIVTGLSLLSMGWSIKKHSGLGWLLVIVGVFSIIVGFMMMFNIGSGASGISVFFGLQVIIAGIGLILLSFVKKSISGKVKDAAKNLKEKYNA